MKRVDVRGRTISGTYDIRRRALGEDSSLSALTHIIQIPVDTSVYMNVRWVLLIDLREQVQR